MELLRVSKGISKAAMVMLIAIAFVCLYKARNDETVVHRNEDYAKNYNVQMRNSLDNAYRTLNYSLFSDKHSFFYLNTIKYSNDIRNVMDIHVKPSNTAAVEKLTEYSFVSIFAALIMVILAIQYLAENYNGMKKIVRAAVSGRFGLSLKRTSIMALICIVLSIVINFIAFAILLISYGGTQDLLNPIQSSPYFSLFPHKINILQFFYLYCLFFAGAMFVTGQIIYFIMQLTNTGKISYLAIIGVFGLEYILYLTIPASSALCFLKYINLTYVLMPGMAMLYENWGNNAFVTDVYGSTLLMMLILSVVFVVANNLLYVFKYEMRKNKLVEKIQKVFQKILAKMNSFMLETYKILFLQFGIIIIGIFVVLLTDTKIMRGAGDGNINSYIYKFYEQFSGATPNEETESYINNLKEQLNDLRSGTVANSKQRSRELSEAIAKLDYTQQYLVNLKEEKDIDGQFVNPEMYNDIFGERLYNNQLNINLLCIVAVILCVGGVFAYERRHNMINLLNSCTKRGKVTLNKALVSAIMVIIIWGLSFALNWLNILDIYKLPIFDMPIQSLPQFYDFGLHLNVWGYIIFCQLFRLFWLLMLGVIVFVVSMFFEYAVSIAISMLLLLPHLLYILKLEAAKVLSPVILLDYTRIVNESEGSTMLNIVYFILYGLIIIELCLVRKRKIRGS